MIETPSRREFVRGLMPAMPQVVARGGSRQPQTSKIIPGRGWVRRAQENGKEVVCVQSETGSNKGGRRCVQKVGWQVCEGIVGKAL